MSERTIKIMVIISSIVLIVLIIIFWEKIFRHIISPISNIILKPQQEAYISKLHPSVQDKFRQFISRVENETGYTVILTSGYRTFAEQEKEHNDNASNPKPGYSMHNYGLAADINATNGTNYLRKSSSKSDWEKSGIPQIAKEVGLTWGGNFSSYYDPVHYGLDGSYDINELRTLAINQFGTNWDNIQGNEIYLA